ncbi:ComEC family competence protein [Acetobacter sp. AN02]|uniref:ComEC/Rec2 family competence protein n=1 Tax=Acetobacter sp. AN02 TaxID=2894186 RepID=UPI0024344EBB|nr:ComEC/Rec2 family competence protein [Acetobacter sp. AN02]MDG6094680.1 ComEC family competence protein [Acetobacter sp. AN02]
MLSLLYAERARLPLWLPVGLAAGVLLFFQLRSEPPLWPAATAACAGLALLCAGWRYITGRIAGCALMMIGVGFSAAWLQIHRMPPLPELPREAVIMTARIQAVDSLPDRDGAAGSRRITVSESVFDTPLSEGMPPLRRTLRIRLQDTDRTPLAPGNGITLRALLQPPPFPAWPGARDEQLVAWVRGEGGTGRALDPVTPEQNNPQGASFIEALRETVASRIAARLPRTDGAITATLLAGVSSAIPAADRMAFAASGLAHLLAVAGLHLGIVMGLVMSASRLLLALWERSALTWPCREIAAFTALAAGAGYVVLTGMHLPAVRSLAMAALVVLALMTGRRAASMRGLAVAAVILLLSGPASLLDVSFQMSFAAVMALIAGYEVLRGPLMRLAGEGQWYRRFLVHVAGLALTSFLAGMATLPVSVAHFGEIQPFFIVANLLAVPLTALWVLPAGLLSLILMPFHLEGPMLSVTGAGVHVIVGMAREVASWPAARIAAPAMPGTGLALFLFGLCWLCLWSRRWRLAGLLPMLAGAVSPWFVSLPDIMIASDGGVIGIRGDNAVLIAGKSRDGWRAQRDWSQALALPSELLEAEESRPADGLVCGQEGPAGYCMVSRGLQSVLLRVSDRTDGLKPVPDGMCDGVSLFISVSPARRGCPGVRTLDRFTAWREGAQSVWLRGSDVQVRSDRGLTGARLWEMRPGAHGVPVLPQAQEE